MASEQKTTARGGGGGKRPPGSPRARTVLADVARAIEYYGENRIDIPPETLRAFRENLAEFLRHPSARIRIAAMKLVSVAARYNLDLYATCDKIQRLDTGRPTENVQTFELEFDRHG